MGQSIIRSCILNLATGTPYLMHAMLGVAAAHMSYLLPPEVNAVQHARNNLADAWHWGRALALFRKELGGDGSLAGASKHNMDGLLSTIMLVAIHQFMLRGEDANLSDNRGSEIWKTSFVFVEDDEERLVAMKWLTIQSGFKMLLGQLERYLAESVWLPVLQDADTQQAFRRLAFISASSKRDTDEVETLLCAICNITNDSTPDNNTYYHTLETVLGVRRLRPVRAELFNKLITVMGRITPELKKLLWMRDVPALLILCHWLSLMAELKQWWLAARSEQECRAIVVYLLAQSSEGDMASQIRRALCEPAIAVGIRI
jgi:Fungal specific transcription factor domain